MLNQERDERPMDDLAADDVVMSVVALALASPVERREAYIHGACGGDPNLMRQVREYLEWEERMDGFLDGSLFLGDEPPFQHGDVAAGRFDILRDAGEGGMGWVYEGWDRQLNCRVAIKCSKAGFRKRLPPEVLNAREIAHRNVCKVFDIHAAQTRHGQIEFISMEFLEGETLAERLEKARLGGGRLSKREALGLGKQICGGLAEAHRKGVVHGDVKSNNVIITKDVDGQQRAVVTDFGLARTLGAAGIRGTAQSMAGGAMDYIAPELWNGGKATRASDVYGLGVILCELLTGRRPFGPEVRIEQRLKGKPPAMETNWDRVLARCLEPDSRRRFQSGAEVAEAIERKLAQGKRFRRLFLAAGAGVVLVSLGAMGAYRTAVAPQDTVRLAVLPFSGDADSAALIQGALLDAGNRLGHVKSGRARRLTVIPVSDALQNRADQPAKARTLLGATDALMGEWKRDGDRVKISAHLIDTSSLAHLQDWQAVYSANELQNIPVALAGMVTGTFHLPPLAAAATVNAAAYQDYAVGAAMIRRNPDVARAIPLLQRAVERDPDSPLTHAKLAEAQFLEYTITRNPDWQARALASLANAQKRNPDAVEALLVSAMINAASGDYYDALEALSRATDLEPKNGDVWRQLGQIYEDSGQFANALRAFSNAVTFQPQYFRNYQVLGAYYFSLGDYEAAAREREIMVSLVPDLADAHYALAAPYLNLGKYQDAEYQLSLAKRIEDTANVELGLGLVRLYQGDNLEAIPYLRRAIEIGPPTPLYYIDLGTALRRAGFTQQALEEYRKGRDLAQDELPRNPRLAYERAWLGYLCARLGERRQAESEAGQALSSSADADVRWMAVQTFEALGEHPRALDLLRDAPASMFLLVERSSDMAGLRREPGYKKILESRHIQ
ncbi:MAG TPA: protein kinase [Bryobacteraceae bacterium]|nr:protein kinase [Bryobacteraceae bacterium]